MRYKIMISVLLILFMVACMVKQKEPEVTMPEPKPEPEPEPEPEPVVEGPSNVDVQILSRAFEPEEVSLNVGDSITFINSDGENKHKIYQKAGGFISPIIFPEERFEHVFEEPGEFEILDFGKKFKLKVVVE